MVIVIPSLSVNGLKNPGVEPPRPESGLPAEPVSVNVMTRRLASIRSAWDTSVLDTAMNPPMRVYDATAMKVRTTPVFASIPNIVSNSFEPPTRPELT